MALSVIASQNQKTWDATVRVTGGHPLQLWGIGQSQLAAEAGGLEVDRVVARDGQERMVGYGQLQIRQEGGGAGGRSTTVVECLNVHANRASAVPALLDALADYAQRVWGADMFSAELDAPSSPELIEAIGARGWQRTGAVAEGDGGPRRLRVNLGSSERDLSSRLPEQTLERCRSGLRVSDVTVREVTTDSGDVRAAGLKTQQISRLLRELGQDSLLLVATQEKDGQEPTALGYLWFVHTVGQAMLYRVGFTRTARELGIDDALLLTGAVELQKRGVQRLDGGDAADPDVPTVVRELADRQRVILGPWRKPLGEVAAQLAGAAEAVDGSSSEREEHERARRGLFGRRPRREGEAKHSAKTGHDRGHGHGTGAARAGAAAASSTDVSTVPADSSTDSSAAAGPGGAVEPAAAAEAAADRSAAKRRDVVRRQVSSDLGAEGADQTPAPSSTAVEDAPGAQKPAARRSPGRKGSGRKEPAAKASGPSASPAKATAAKASGPKASGGKSAGAKAAGGKGADAGAAEARPASSGRSRPASPPAPSGTADSRAADDPASDSQHSDSQHSDARPSASPAASTAARSSVPAAAPRGEGSVGEGPGGGRSGAKRAPAAAEDTGARAEGGPSGAREDGDQGDRRTESQQRRAERLARKAAEVEAQRRPKKPPLARRLRDEASAAMRDALGR